jgi:hypothetical protein
MKRLLLALLCLLAPAGILAQCTTGGTGTGSVTVSGNLKDVGGVNSTGSNTFVRFTLNGYGSNIPKVTGTNAIATPCYDFHPNASGNISGTIQGNDTISVGANPAGGTDYVVCIFFNGQQFRCNNYTITGFSWNLNNATPNSTNPVIPAPNGNGSYFRLDAGNSPITGATAINNSLAVSGNVTATAGQNILNAYNINGVLRVDGVKYAKTEAGIQSAINDAVAAGGGTVDARGVPSITFTSQLDVGANASPNQAVALLLPKIATWSVSMNSPTNCGIMVHDKSSVIGLNGQGNGNLFVVAAANSSTNVSGLVCTDPSPMGGGSYTRIEGLMALNNVGATLGRGAIVIQQTFDNSVFRDLTSVNSNGIGTQVINACCGTSFYNLLSDGNSSPGAQPLVIGNTGVGGVISGRVNTVGFFGISVTHPGAGLNNISFANTAFTENVNFYALYMEPNVSDTTTPLIQIPANVHNVNIFGGEVSATAGGSTAYMVDIANWAGPCGCVFQGLKNQTNKLINDHITGMQVIGAGASYGHGAGYTSGPYLMSSLGIGAGAAVTSTGAGGTMGAIIASGTTTLTSGNIANATCQTAVTSSATGAATTDSIEWAYASAPGGTTDALLTVSPYVTANNVNFTRCNTSATNPIASTGMVINWRVVR